MKKAPFTEEQIIGVLREHEAGDGQQNNRRYTTVTVTNRGQNGYADQVVQQQVPCGSQYYDGYRQRIAPGC